MKKTVVLLGCVIGLACSSSALEAHKHSKKRTKKSEKIVNEKEMIYALDNAHYVERTSQEFPKNNSAETEANNPTEFQQSAQDQVVAASEEVKTDLVGMKEELKNEVDFVVQKMVEGKEAVQYVADKVSDAKAMAEAKIEVVAQNAVDELKQTFENVKEKAQEAGQYIAEKVNHAKEAIKDAEPTIELAENKVQDVSKSVKYYTDQSSGKVTTLKMENLAMGVHNMKDRVVIKASLPGLEGDNSYLAAHSKANVFFDKTRGILVVEVNKNPKQEKVA